MPAKVGDSAEGRWGFRKEQERSKGWNHLAHCGHIAGDPLETARAFTVDKQGSVFASFSYKLGLNPHAFKKFWPHCPRLGGADRPMRDSKASAAKDSRAQEGTRI